VVEGVEADRAVKRPTLTPRVRRLLPWALILVGEIAFGIAGMYVGHELGEALGLDYLAVTLTMVLGTLAGLAASLYALVWFEGLRR
jgi:hypothetical protein